DPSAAPSAVAPGPQEWALQQSPEARPRFSATELETAMEWSGLFATVSARASAPKHRAGRQQAAAQPSASAMGPATEMRSSGPGARVSARPAAERAPLAQALVRQPEVRFSVFAIEPAKETESS